MNVNIDELVDMTRAIMPPWSLTVEINGASYIIRELTDEDLQRLDKVGEMSEQDGREFVQGLFTGAAPDVEKLSISKRLGLFGVVGLYVASRTKLFMTKLQRIELHGPGKTPSEKAE